MIEQGRDCVDPSPTLLTETVILRYPFAVVAPLFFECHAGESYSIQDPLVGLYQKTMAFRLTLYDFSGEAAWSSDEPAPLTVRSLRLRLAVHLKRPVAMLQILEDAEETSDGAGSGRYRNPHFFVRNSSSFCRIFSPVARV